jgi:hypothetical protein
VERRLYKACREAVKWREISQLQLKMASIFLFQPYIQNLRIGPARSFLPHQDHTQMRLPYRSRTVYISSPGLSSINLMVVESLRLPRRNLYYIGNVVNTPSEIGEEREFGCVEVVTGLNGIIEPPVRLRAVFRSWPLLTDMSTVHSNQVELPFQFDKD